MAAHVRHRRNRLKPGARTTFASKHKLVRAYRKCLQAPRRWHNRLKPGARIDFEKKPVGTGVWRGASGSPSSRRDGKPEARPNKRESKISPASFKEGAGTCGETGSTCGPAKKVTISPLYVLVVCPQRAAERTETKTYRRNNNLFFRSP